MTSHLKAGLSGAADDRKYPANERDVAAGADARVEAIDRIDAILPVVRDAMLRSAKGEGYWTGRIIAADPATQTLRDLEEKVRVLTEAIVEIEPQIRICAYNSAGDPSLHDDMKMFAIWAGTFQKALNAAGAK